jgi:hypothetical protein
LNEDPDDVFERIFSDHFKIFLIFLFLDKSMGGMSDFLGFLLEALFKDIEGFLAFLE